MNSMVTCPGPTRYDPVAIGFHWAIAALILADFALAESFARFDPGDALYFRWAYPAHMSVGMFALAASLARLGWRSSHRYPRMPSDMGAVMRALAHGTHGLLYAFLLAVPVSGWIVLTARNTPPVLVGALHWPNIPGLPGLARAQRIAIHERFLQGHVLLSYAGMGLVALHAVAALYHHLWRNDGVLRRMLPASVVSPAPRKELQ